MDAGHTGQQEADTASQQCGSEAPLGIGVSGVACSRSFAQPDSTCCPGCTAGKSRTPPQVLLPRSF